MNSICGTDTNEAPKFNDFLLSVGKEREQITMHRQRVH